MCVFGVCVFGGWRLQWRGTDWDVIATWIVYVRRREREREREQEGREGGDLSQQQLSE